MFYSRPKIEPLGWDLRGWPEPEGTKHFYAITSDWKPVDFRFSGGWLTVSRGPVGASVDCPEMEEVLAVKIAPFGIMDIEAEQICDMLGITVNGCRVDSAGIRTGARGFDWSGQTTTWDSCHLMQSRNDAPEFVQKLCDAFPGSMLIQTEYGAHGHSRSRQISFLMASDEGAWVGAGPKHDAVKRMLAREQGPEEGEKAFAYSVGFLRDDLITTDPTGTRNIYHQAAGLGVKYDVIQHRRFRMRFSYETENPEAQAYTDTVLSVMRATFWRGLEVVNLQTGTRIAEDLPSSGDRSSYSVALRDEWRERAERYLFVARSVVARSAEGSSQDRLKEMTTAGSRESSGAPVRTNGTCGQRAD